MQYTNSEIDYQIAERIHNERNRQLLRRHLIDGRTYDELSAEFYLSRRQVARIIAQAKRIFTTDQQTDWHYNGTPAALRECLFSGMMKLGKEALKCTIRR